MDSHDADCEKEEAGGGRFYVPVALSCAAAPTALVLARPRGLGEDAPHAHAALRARVQSHGSEPQAGAFWRLPLLWPLQAPGRGRHASHASGRHMRTTTGVLLGMMEVCLRRAHTTTGVLQGMAELQCAS